MQQETEFRFRNLSLDEALRIIRGQKGKPNREIACVWKGRQLSTATDYYKDKPPLALLRDMTTAESVVVRSSAENSGAAINASAITTEYNSGLTEAINAILQRSPQNAVLNNREFKKPCLLVTGPFPPAFIPYNMQTQMTLKFPHGQIVPKTILLSTDEVKITAAVQQAYSTPANGEAEKAEIATFTLSLKDGLLNAALNNPRPLQNPLLDPFRTVGGPREPIYDSTWEEIKSLPEKVVAQCANAKVVHRTIC